MHNSINLFICIKCYTHLQDSLKYEEPYPFMVMNFQGTFQQAQHAGWISFPDKQVAANLGTNYEWVCPLHAMELANQLDKQKLGRSTVPVQP